MEKNTFPFYNSNLNSFSLNFKNKFMLFFQNSWVKWKDLDEKWLTIHPRGGMEIIPSKLKSIENKKKVWEPMHEIGRIETYKWGRIRGITFLTPKLSFSIHFLLYILLSFPLTKHSVIDINKICSKSYF